MDNGNSKVLEKKIKALQSTIMDMADCFSELLMKTDNSPCIKAYFGEDLDWVDCEDCQEDYITCIEKFFLERNKKQGGVK